MRHFGSILEAIFDDFSSCFSASFLDRFLEGFGGVLGVILDHFGRYFLELFRT